MEAVDYLMNSDSYTYFEATGDVFKTGLTGTNVMDIVVVLSERESI